ncbi:MAG: BrnA antitoxin family protein [Usitatibacteraceae bacterium]
MKRTSISKTSAATDPDEAPPLTREFFKNATYMVAGKKATKAEWQKAARAQLGEALGKKRISIMLDAAIIEYFKSAAGDRGYQTLINETLKKAMSGESLATELRLVVREELAAYKVR